jgi:hypothetical protein
MDMLQTRRYQMLIRVRDFGQTHGSLFSESSLAGKQFERIAAVVTDLAAHDVSKLSTAREGKITKAMARGAVVDALTAIRRTARAIAEELPDVEDKFHLENVVNDPAVITTGRLFARNAEPLSAEFIGHGLATTFVTDLTKLIDQFEQAIHERDAGKNERTAARKGIDEALANGMAAVRKLDAIVLNQLKDPMVMAVWERDRRVGFPRKTKEAADAATTPAIEQPAPATPSTQAA